HRKPELTRGMPDRIEPRIVDLEQRSVVLHRMKTEHLLHFERTRTELLRFIEELDRDLGKVLRLARSEPGNVAGDQQAPRLESDADLLLETLARPHAGE